MRQVFWLHPALSAFPPILSRFSSDFMEEHMRCYSSGDCSGFAPDSLLNIHKLIYVPDSSTKVIE
jgi:hypothetical protein